MSKESAMHNYEHLTAASTGTSCPARSLVSRGVIMIAPIVEQLQKKDIKIFGQICPKPSMKINH